MPVATADSTAALRVHESKNVELVAYHSLGKRPNFKMALQVVDGRYMHLAANMEGYRSNIYVIVDISDPANPREVSRWAVKGQRRDEPAEPQLASLHGPPYVEGNRA